MARHSRSKKLSFVCLLSSTIPSAAALAMAAATGHVGGLLQREAGSCPGLSFDRCDDPNLPSNFCCPKGLTCISLDDSTSALCCPGGECALIQPIVCDVRLQNPDAHPGNPLMTTKLDKDLPKCGVLCCPRGYSCQGENTCSRDKATSTTSSQTTTSSTLTTQPASSLSSTSTQEAIATITSIMFLFPTAASGTSASVNADCPAFPGGAVAAGFFPGLITGALITLLAMVFIGQRRRKKALEQHYRSKSGHFRNRSSDGAIIGISDPMPGEIDNSVRTDFLRHTPSHDGGASSNHSKSRFYRTGSRVKSLFVASPKMYETSTPPPPIPPVYRPTPSTPPGRVHRQRQPSTESIKVYSPDHIVRGHGSLRPDLMRSNTRPNTTFTEMMERVGFQNSNGSPHFNVTVTPPTQSTENPRR